MSDPNERHQKISEFLADLSDLCFNFNMGILLGGQYNDQITFQFYDNKVLVSDLFLGQEGYPKDLDAIFRTSTQHTSYKDTIKVFDSTLRELCLRHGITVSRNIMAPNIVYFYHHNVSHIGGGSVTTTTPIKFSYSGLPSTRRLEGHIGGFDNTMPISIAEDGSINNVQ